MSVATSGIVWDIASNKTLNDPCVETSNAFSGNDNKCRCLEIVVGPIIDQARIERLAAITKKMLNDARRILNKTQQRLMKRSTNINRIDEEYIEINGTQ